MTIKPNFDTGSDTNFDTDTDSTDSTDFIDVPDVASTPIPSSGIDVTTAGLNDPIVSALTKRAADLSLSIVNPATLASKLRESLIDLADKDAAVYHIGIEYNASTQIAKVEISRLTPHFVAKLDSNLTSASIGLAYTNRTISGWKVAVGLEVSDDFKKPHGSGIVASFGVTISK